MNNLFSAHDGEKSQLAARCAPGDLGEFFGQEKLLGMGGALLELIRSDRMPSSIFYGPPGSGKTALAKIIARRTRSEFLRLNAVTAKTEDLRTSLKRAENNRLLGKTTLLFIDEIHRFNKMVQDGLLPALEEDVVTLIGTTTKNPFFYLIPPLRSRVLLFEFESLSIESLDSILEQAEKREGFSLKADARKYLLQYADGDARRMFNVLQAALLIGSTGTVTLQDIQKIMGRQHLQYDRDEDYHYDVISAFIKSVRGSDPDAALYWLVLMLEAGEDPLYIARRLIILASEDIGLADPNSLPIAVSAFSAVDSVGMPEARIILSHATLHLTLAPKSNSSYRALEKASSFLKKRGTLAVPDHLRSAHPASKNYRYPHDYQYHYVVQPYMQEQTEFYEPGMIGEEKRMKQRLEFLKRLRDEDTHEKE
jgi:putative ATPase